MSKALIGTLELTEEPANIWARPAACESHCGQQEKAISCLMHALTLDSNDPRTPGLIRQISPHRDRQYELTAIAHRGPILHLEPMTLQHAHAFFWQYRDPQIAAWLAMDPLPDLDAAHTWITQESARPGKRSFAIMHADDGFIGEVGYIGNGETAFVHYWIGCDHQGKGYAAPAVATMCEQARSEGNELLFTSCRPENLRSLRVLARIGFTEMAMPPLSDGDKDLSFFVLQLTKNNQVHAFDQLTALLDWMGCPLMKV